LLVILLPSAEYRCRFVQELSLTHTGDYSRRSRRLKSPFPATILSRRVRRLGLYRRFWRQFYSLHCIVYSRRKRRLYSVNYYTIVAGNGTVVAFFVDCSRQCGRCFINRPIRYVLVSASQNLLTCSVAYCFCRHDVTTLK